MKIRFDNASGTIQVRNFLFALFAQSKESQRKRIARYDAHRKLTHVLASRGLDYLVKNRADPERVFRSVVVYIENGLVPVYTHRSVERVAFSWLRIAVVEDVDAGRTR